MASFLDAILGMSGQERTEALRQFGRDLEYYVPPELRGVLGFAAEMTPTAALERAAQAGGEMLAPDRTAMERLGSAGQMLSETAGVAAPMMVAGRAAMPAAQAIQEGLLGFSVAADDVGRRFVERMNQPGPVPTMYSGPAGFADYLKRVNPRGVRVAAEDRPNLMMGDMYGMLPSGAKRVGKQGDVTFYRGKDGDFYATAFNPDVGEQDVVGYIMPRGDMTELAVVDEMQGQGIGGELQYLFRKENPDAPTGGLTEAGEKALRKTYERLSSEGLLGNPVGRAANDAPKGILAYHGSPHDFDRFSMSKIGTGEGAQAYGHGLYFAEAEPVARGYRDALSIRAAPGDAQGNAYDLVQRMGGDEEWTAETLRDAIKNVVSPNTKQFLEDTLKHVENKTYADYAPPTGRMYEVNIKANPEDFLDWDKPLSEQPQNVRDFANARWQQVFGRNPDPTIEGEYIAKMASPQHSIDGREWLDTGPAADQARRLREAGIPGIKYLDAGSRGAGEGSRNYVVFDENLIDIVRKYGIAGAALMLGMSQADLAQAMQAQQQQQPQGLLGGPQ